MRGLPTRLSILVAGSKGKESWGSDLRITPKKCKSVARVYTIIKRKSSPG